MRSPVRHVLDDALFDELKYPPLVVPLDKGVGIDADVLAQPAPRLGTDVEEVGVEVVEEQQ